MIDSNYTFIKTHIHRPSINVYDVYKSMPVDDTYAADKLIGRVYGGNGHWNGITETTRQSIPVQSTRQKAAEIVDSVNIYS